MERVNFTQMKDGTKEEYEFLTNHEIEYTKGTAERLLTALENGQVGHATLDVFRVEPLPTDHPFWTHPKVTVTPHIASTTRPETAAEVITDNILRGEAGQPFRYLVDRNRGY